LVGKADEIRNIAKKYGKVTEVAIKDGPKRTLITTTKLGIP
jgi:hypothetical protein